jgi:phage-related protein
MDTCCSCPGDAVSYQPNFSDPRVRRRVKRAVGFVCGVFSPVRSHSWSTRYIDRWLGQAQNPLSQYLRTQLLIETNSHWNKDTGQCKQYRLNSSGAQFLSDACGFRVDNNNSNNYHIVLQVAQEEYQAELESGVFEYTDKSSRLWHPLQNFRREIKHSVLSQSGYQYHYDIECCAMTLIHQHSQRIPEHVLDGTWQQGPMDLYLFALREYIRDRTRIREQIAQDCEIDPDTVKRIINAVLAGAQISRNPSTAVYQMLQGDLARIEFLKQHEYLTQLRADIRTCWEHIRPTMGRRTVIMKSGGQRRLPISSKQKWSVYFDLERQVLNEIREYLTHNNNRHFLEHDGWSCEIPVDLVQLKQQIRNNTGFQIEFECH